MAKRVEQIRGPFDPHGQPNFESQNSVYLGVFAWNLAGGGAPTIAVMEDPERRRDYWQWPAASHLIKEADRIGCEFQVPFGRWLGHGGITEYNENTLDFLTVAAGLAPLTSNILLPSTAHIGYQHHPAQFAKWGAAIDHMSGGRWGLNVVAGWIRDEVEMFGETFMDHDLRYDVCDEFVTFMKHCWYADEPFDFEGDYFTGKDIWVTPKPSRKPRPVLVNAGYSPAGMDFATKHCDWLFAANPSGDPQDLGDVANRAKEQAEKYNRQVRVMSFCYCIWEETDEKAEALLAEQQGMMDELATSWHLYRGLDQPGTKTGASFSLPLGGETATLKQAVGAENFVRYGLGIAGRQIVGGYDSVAEHIRMLHTDYGQEGQLFCWLDPLRGIHQLEDHIIPRLRKMGLRK